MDSVKKIAFFDRDGVINKKAPPDYYIITTKEFIFNPGIFHLLGQLQSEGYEIIVITNQRGIARSKLTESALNDIHRFMMSTLKAEKIEILDIFVCPHEKNSCECRKPKPGLLRQAVEKYRIDLGSSLFVTDSENEINMGREFGIGNNILIPSDDLSYYYEQKN